MKTKVFITRFSLNKNKFKSNFYSVAWRKLSTCALLANVFIVTSISSNIYASSEFTACEKTIGSEKANWITEKALCHNSTGALARLEFWNNEKNYLIQFYEFDKNERMLKYQTFNSEGQSVINTEYLPLDNGLVKVGPHRGKNPKQHEFSFFKIQLRPQFIQEKVETHFYEEQHLIRKEFYTNALGPSYIGGIEIFDRNQLKEKYVLDIKPGPRSSVLIENFQVFDDKGKNIRSFSFNEALGLQLQTNLTSFKSKKPVAIIDSGIDFTHPDLKNKIALLENGSPFSSSPIMGWGFEPMTSRDGSSIQEQIFYDMGRFPYVPFSHGTHVAGIAFRNINTFGLVGYVGDYSNPDYLEKIKDSIKVNKIRFSNLSFGFGDQKNPFGANSFSRKSVVDLMQLNPNTLFFVAAGNDTQDLDDEEKDDVPAKANVLNKVVVGALDCDEIDETKLDSYQIASFSNFGSKEVDILAPGKLLNSANVGKGHIRISGTSMASPFALNLALSIAEVNPSLSNEEIRKIIYKTAYKSKLILKHSKHGIIRPNTALKIARLSISVGVEKAIGSLR